MLIAYFDEVKFDPPSRPFYWLGAIVVPEALLRELERHVAELALECFGDASLRRETEFHAADIWGRRHNFAKWHDIGRRIDVLKRLLSIIDRRGEVFKISIQIDPSKMVKPDSFEAWAFMFLVERLNQLLVAEKELGLLIGDYENEVVTNRAAEKLSSFRAGGTPYYFGQKIGRLVDTVHFSRSHLSRLLQLADVFSWALQFSVCGNHAEYPGKELFQHLCESTELLAFDKYKHWPTEYSWYSSES